MFFNKIKIELTIKFLVALVFLTAPFLNVIATENKCDKRVQAEFEAELNAEFLVEESSNTLEEWMTDADRWSFPGEEFQETHDANILESWMTSKDHWRESVDAILNVSDVILDDWMFDPCHWRFNSVNICNVNHNGFYPDEDILIQPWMKDPFFFKV